MSVKDQKKAKNTGLGRSLGDLLSDNEELGNVENKVLMHKKDGSTVKIYNKVDAKGKPESNKNSREEHTLKRTAAENERIASDSAEHPNRASAKDDERLHIGKTREEREEEARGIYRSGKPHVIVEGEHTERIRITAQPKPSPEPERIVLDGSKTSDEGVADALGKLKKYSPRASDEFLEALRDMTDVPEIKDYPTDKDGRIVIGATKSRVKKR